MGRLLGLGLQGQTHHFSHLFITDGPWSPAAWQIEQPRQARGMKALAQPAHGMGAKAGLGTDLLIIKPIGESQNDTSTRTGFGC